MTRFQITKLQNYSITKSRTGLHGKHNCTQQRRTQESETHRAEEAQNRVSIKAPRIRTRVEEAESQEDGARTGEALEQGCPTLVAHFATGWEVLGGHPSTFFRE
jgi:hypothetical protein